MKLYIIGNGFDLWHGLLTSYKHFNCFMRKEHPIDHERIGRIFNPKNIDMLWSDFETMLGEIDISSLVTRNLSNWISITNLYEFENEFDTLHSDLHSFFQEWVTQINTSNINSKRLQLDSTALFLNFNYTNTLEHLYDVPAKNICYIHGDTLNNNLRVPIFGHGKQIDGIIDNNRSIIYNQIDMFLQLPPWAENVSDFVNTIIKEIDGLLTGLKKVPNNNVLCNKSHFDQYSNIDDIFVLGHSMSIIDIPYFDIISKQSSNAKWHISYSSFAC